MVLGAGKKRLALAPLAPGERSLGCRSSPCLSRTQRDTSQQAPPAQFSSATGERSTRGSGPLWAWPTSFRGHLGDDERVFFDAHAKPPVWVTGVTRSTMPSSKLLSWSSSLTRNWLLELSLRDPSEDEVRYEIKAALERNTTLLPVTVLGAQRPTRSKLPEELAALDDAEWYSLGEDDSGSRQARQGRRGRSNRHRGRFQLETAGLAVADGASLLFLAQSPSWSSSPLLSSCSSDPRQSMPPLGASAAVTTANPDRLTSELLSSQMSSGTLPIGTSPQSPQLDSFNSYSIQGLNASGLRPANRSSRDDEYLQLPRVRQRRRRQFVLFGLESCAERSEGDRSLSTSKRKRHGEVRLRQGCGRRHTRPDVGLKLLGTE